MFKCLQQMQDNATFCTALIFALENTVTFNKNVLLMSTSDGIHIET